MVSASTVEISSFPLGDWPRRASLSELRLTEDAERVIFDLHDRLGVACFQTPVFLSELLRYRLGGDTLALLVHDKHVVPIEHGRALHARLDTQWCPVHLAT